VLDQARSIGVGKAIRGNASPEDVVGLERLATLAAFLQTRLDKSLGKALEFNTALAPVLEADVKASAAAVRSAADAITAAAEVRVRGVDVREYDAAVRGAVESIFRTQGLSVASLDRLLDARARLLQRDVYYTLAWAAGGLLIVCLAGAFIMRDVSKTLREVVGVADQIAEGDLAGSTIAATRKDEMGALARAFDRMVATLNDSVAVAQRIAAGDLAVSVRPRSERDAMGNALANMVASLSALVSEVQRSGVQVNMSVNDIAATAKQHEATAAEIAATTTEVSATSKAIAATAHDLVTTIHEVTEVAEESAALAGSGQAGLARMESTMRQVMEAAGSINAKLSVVSEKASTITQVVTTITKVADQTNLLSLNAAIEAEKAGEYGRGFAVVATEIRRLADQTAVATFDIDQIVREMQSAVSAGVMGMDKFSEEVRRGMEAVHQVGDQLSQIIQHVQTLAPRIESVNQGMRTQATSAEQITEALAQLSTAAQQTVEALRQSRQAIDGLNQVSTGLRGELSRFTLAA
jgi:methyl-accepting chemotaxis protein WspA